MDYHNTVTKTTKLNIEEKIKNFIMERKGEHFDNEYFEEDIKTENDDEEEYKPDFIIHVCNICQKVYKSMSGLSGHIKSVHKELKYPCDQCDKRFTQEGHLKTHIQSVHENINYYCNQKFRKIFTSEYIKC